MSRIPLLLLHGALGSQEQLVPLASLLNDSFEVHKLDFSGHGGRPVKGLEFSIDLFAENVIDYLESEKLTSIDIFGYSMGGYFALKVAQQQPELVNRIFTLGTKFHWTPESALSEIKMLNPEKIKEKVPALAQALQERHHPESWETVMHKTAEMMMNLGNGKAFSTEELKLVKNKVLITVGSSDNMVSIDESKHTAERLPNSQFKTIPDWQHPIEKVDVSLLSEMITEYFE